MQRITQVAKTLVAKHGVHPDLALATAAHAFANKAGVKVNPPVVQGRPDVLKTAAAVRNSPAVVNPQAAPQHPVTIPGLKTLLAPTTPAPEAPAAPTGGGPNSGIAYVSGPYVPPGGVNPYSGKQLGANEYVGVAGSEMDHPGMVRIPPPGWNNPDSPFYERRDYWRAPDGSIVANEPGFQASADHPYNTGRPGEVNSEFASRPGYQHIQYDSPGVQNWGPGQTEPGAMPFQTPSSVAGLPDWLVKWFQYLQAQR